MSGYTSDEKLRLQQLRELRRRWLKDQELSPREPVLPPRRVWPMEQFWNKFLQDGASWKNVTKPYAIVERKPRIFPVSLKTSLVFLLFIIFLFPFPTDH
uniref:NADH dehydrogenase [ubiquinone] 1 beta subcomplex subunit 6 n=1 Tax=Monodon monoceros TaxID=40151 RepID=A0A8C6CDD6_MONMO